MSKQDDLDNALIACARLLSEFASIPDTFTNSEDQEEARKLSANWTAASNAMLEEIAQDAQATKERQ